MTEIDEPDRETPTIDDDRGEIWVRATINMPGLHQGEHALVNPDIPYIGAALENRYLIACDEPAGDAS